MTNKGSWISLLIGAPIGLMLIGLFSFLIIVATTLISQGEGLLTMVIEAFYYYPFIGLTISFLLSLWFTGRLAEIALRKKQTLSWKYSLITNLIMWSTFILVHLAQFHENFDFTFGFIIPLILGFFSTIFSIFTIGLLICYIIKKRVFPS